MPRKPVVQKAKLKVEAIANVKAEVSAKASYQRKRTHMISETIPEDVTRLRASAWLDVVSPAREWLGMKGDQIRNRRAQLRLQQEVVLAEIERRAAAAVAPDATIHAVPAKFLVPFIEQASLEDTDSPLIEMWANLLASAIEGYDGQHLHLSRLIAGLSAQQALLLRDGFTANTLQGTVLAMDDVQTFLEEFRAARTLITRVGQQKPADNEQFASVIADFLDNAAVEVLHAAFWRDDEGDDYLEVNFPYRTANDDNEVDYAILVSMGLIERVSIEGIKCSLGLDTWWTTVIYFHLTRLGMALCKGCKMRPFGPPPTSRQPSFKSTHVSDD